GGDEQDVRLWAWLAFLRRADQVVFDQVLPARREADAPADPGDLVWFYPGEWFGRTEPVPTVQLKWLRAAEQDYEYLTLARRRGQGVNALWMARVLTKPVQVQPGQSADPAYALMTGTTDPKAWADARRLLARAIVLPPAPDSSTVGDADDSPDARAARYTLDNEVLQWARPQEQPLLIGRTTTWSWARPARRDDPPRVTLDLGLDVYNAADVNQERNHLRWASMPAGWEVRPQPTPVPALETYRVLRAGLTAAFDPAKITPAAQQPADLELAVESKEVKFVSKLRLALPVASSDRREGRFALDGKLEDWTPADRIQDGPLVRMLARPAVLGQRLEPASTATQLYTNWTPANLYLAFGLNGVGGTGGAGGPGGNRNFNFVEYQNRRAWGEDLCEALVQPVYADGTSGAALHVVCKPNGTVRIERKAAPTDPDGWVPHEGADVQYVTYVGEGRWTGELAIPWELMRDAKRGMPTLLRFNFAQHRQAAGEDASWAGPVDFGRDDALTGLLYLTAPIPDGTGGTAQGGAPLPRTIDQ
ncbi:MAG: hypothetical protein JWO31_1169, partial [Phycisphaerales bacterium]|nr:hypothetical protein [Phycisphaerales bacterium]